MRRITGTHKPFGTTEERERGSEPVINYDELRRSIRIAQKAVDRLEASGTLDRAREAGAEAQATYDRLKASGSLDQASAAVASVKEYLDSLTEEEREEFLRSLDDEEE